MFQKILELFCKPNSINLTDYLEHIIFKRLSIGVLLLCHKRDIAKKVEDSKADTVFFWGGVKAKISFWTLRPTEKWGTEKSGELK